MIYFLTTLALTFISFIFASPKVWAHEAYVLPADQFHAGLKVFSVNPLAPLIDPTHLKTFIAIGILVALSYILVFLWASTKLSESLDRLIKKAAVIGPIIIRLAISASFFYSAASNVILGPELPLGALPYGSIIRFILFLLAAMIITGTLTEIAGAIGFIIFIYISRYFGWYMVTYTNYLGELIVLAIFGSRFLSFDRLFFGEKRWFSKANIYKFLETPIVRALYGVALIYAGYTIKFAHQGLSIDVYNQYHLGNFFHSDAAFIAAGAGLSEILIGLFILLGLAMRWTIFVSLIFITLSITYFKELLWPHFMLYGISFSLIINSGDPFTLDHYLVPRIKKIISALTYKKSEPSSAA